MIDITQYAEHFRGLLMSDVVCNVGIALITAVVSGILTPIISERVSSRRKLRPRVIASGIFINEGWGDYCKRLLYFALRTLSMPMLLMVDAGLIQLALWCGRTRAQHWNMRYIVMVLFVITVVLILCIAYIKRCRPRPAWFFAWSFLAAFAFSALCFITYETIVDNYIWLIPVFGGMILDSCLIGGLYVAVKRMRISKARFLLECLMLLLWTIWTILYYDEIINTELVTIWGYLWFAWIIVEEIIVFFLRRREKPVVCRIHNDGRDIYSPGKITFFQEDMIRFRAWNRTDFVIRMADDFSIHCVEKIWTRRKTGQCIVRVRGADTLETFDKIRYDKRGRFCYLTRYEGRRQIEAAYPAGDVEVQTRLDAFVPEC